MVFKKILRKIREKKQPNADEKFKEFRGELSAICRNIAKSKDIGNVSKEEVKLARMQTEAGNLTISYHDTRFIESYKKAIDKYIKMVNARVEYISRLEKIGDEIRVDLSEIFDGQNTIEEVLYGKMGREHGEEKPYDTLTHVDQEPDEGIVRTSRDYITPDDNR